MSRCLLYSTTSVICPPKHKHFFGKEHFQFGNRHATLRRQVLLMYVFSTGLFILHWCYMLYKVHVNITSPNMIICWWPHQSFSDNIFKVLWRVVFNNFFIIEKCTVLLVSVVVSCNIPWETNHLFINVILLQDQNSLHYLIHLR